MSKSTKNTIARLRRKGLSYRDARDVAGQIGSGTDWLAMRQAGSFKAHYKHEKRFPGALEYMRGFARDKYWHYGHAQGLPR